MTKEELHKASEVMSQIEELEPTLDKLRRDVGFAEVASLQVGFGGNDVRNYTVDIPLELLPQINSLVRDYYEARYNALYEEFAAL